MTPAPIPLPAPLPPAPVPLPPAPNPMPLPIPLFTVEQAFRLELRKLLERKVWTAPHQFRVAAHAWLDSHPGA